MSCQLRYPTTAMAVAATASAYSVPPGGAMPPDSVRSPAAAAKYPAPAPTDAAIATPSRADPGHKSDGGAARAEQRVLRTAIRHQQAGELDEGGQPDQSEDEQPDRRSPLRRRSVAAGNNATVASSSPWTWARPSSLSAASAETRAARLPCSWPEARRWSQLRHPARRSRSPSGCCPARTGSPPRRRVGRSRSRRFRHPGCARWPPWDRRTTTWVEWVGRLPRFRPPSPAGGVPRCPPAVRRRPSLRARMRHPPGARRAPAGPQEPGGGIRPMAGGQRCVRREVRIGGKDYLVRGSGGFRVCQPHVTRIVSRGTVRADRGAVE